MKRLGWLALILASISICGCASYFKRKECEKLNWFDYGQSVAMRGDRLDADVKLNECRKVEADINEQQLDVGFKSGMQKYCDPANGYQMGRNGDPFVRDLCEGAPNMRSILNQNQKGITEYCQASNGMQAGASGHKYRNVCTPEQEKGFLPPYRKGRKKYLAAVITDKEQLIREKDDRIRSLSVEQQGLSMQAQQALMERNMIDNQKAQYMGRTDANSVSMASMLDGRWNTANSRYTTYQSQVDTKRVEIDSNRKVQENLRSEISAMRTESAQLEDQ